MSDIDWLRRAAYAYPHVEAQHALHRTEQALQRVADLEAMVYVPGTFRCAKCALVMQASIFYAGDGGHLMAVDRSPQTCPNCSVPMWRISERKEAMQLFEREFEARRECFRVLSETFRRIRSAYDYAPESEYDKKLDGVEKYLVELETAFPEIVAADPMRTGELKKTDHNVDQP